MFKPAVCISVCLFSILFVFSFEALGLENGEEYCEEIGDQFDYAYLKVTAFARAEGYKVKPEDKVEADVYLNGVNVGKTPYRDCLPEGVYKVEIKYEKNTPYVRKVQAVPGEKYTVKGVFLITLSHEERIELKRKRIEEKKKKEEKERKEQLRKWKADIKEWEIATEPLRQKRKPYINYGTIVILGGAVLVITGGVLEGKAFDYHQKAEDAHQMWLESDNPDDQDLLNQIDTYQRRRNIYHAFGIPCLALGGIAVVTAIVIYARMPRLPPPPRRPRDLKTSPKKASITISPVFTGKTVGGGVNISF